MARRRQGLTIIGTRTDPVARLLPVALRLDAEPSEIGAIERFTGAALFADISGFTPLTERLAVGGMEGSELLSGFLSEFFATLMDTVAEAGGDVWVLVGDALLAFWRAPEDAVEAAAQSAVSAGWLALHHLHDARSPDGHHVDLRVSVTVGDMEIALVGDPTSPVPLLSGPAIQDVGLVDSAGQAGHVTVSAAATMHLASADLLVFDNGVARVLSPPDPAQLTFAAPLLSVRGTESIPASIRELAQAESTAWASEFRELTAVFVDLSGAVDFSLEVKTAMVAELQTMLADHGAAFDRIILDDKGLVLVSQFGLPGHRHSDDADRAVRVALAMVAALANHGVSARVGIAAGPAFCSVVGSKNRHQYTAIGEVMNRAARLMAAADTETPVLVDPALRHGAAQTFAFRSLGPRKLKGISDPVEPFVPLGDHGTMPASRSAAMAGRSHERDRLIEAWRVVGRDHRTRVVAIEGEAGIGKSALVGALTDACTADPTTLVLFGAASPTESSTPFRLWRSVLASLLGIEQAHTVTRPQLAHAVESRLGRREDTDVILLSMLFGIVPETALELRPEAIALAMVRLVAELLASTPATTTVIMLEDGHWSDSASWALYRNLARDAPGLLLVMTTRPATEWLAPPGAHPTACPVVALALKPLGAAAVGDIAASALGAARVSPRLTQFFWQRTQGHPLFAVELAQSMFDAGLVTVENGTARLAVSESLLDTAEIPATVQGVLANRIDRLTPHEQRTLKAAAAIGRTFDLDRLVAVADGLPVTEFVPGLVAANLVVATAGTAGAYEFTHALVRDTAYGSMSFQQRRTLNTTLASWYEQDGRAGASPARLAYHWSEAGEADRAIPYALEAGQQSLSAAAYAESAGLFRRAIEMGTEGTGTAPGRLELAGWYERLGFAEQSAGALDRAEAAHRKSLEILNRRFPSDRTLPLYMAGAALSQLARQLRPRRLARATRPANAEIEVAGRSREGLIQVFYMLEESVRSAYGILALVNEGEGAAPTPEMARGLASMGSLCCFAGIGRFAEHYRGLAAEMTDQIGDPETHAASNLYFGLYEITTAQWAAALRDLQFSADLFRQIGEPRRELEATSLLGGAHFLTGSIDTASELFEQVYSGAARLEHRWLEGGGLIERGMVAIRRGQPSVAVELLAEAAELGDSIGRSETIWAGGVHAQALLRSGDPQGAYVVAEATLALMEGVRPAAAFALEGYCGLLEVVHDERVACSPAQVRAASKQLQTLAKAAPVATPRNQYFLGVADRAAGRESPARKHFNQAMELGQLHGMAFDQGIATLAMAELTNDRDQAAVLLDEASTLLTSVGAVTELRQLATVRAQNG